VVRAALYFEDGPVAVTSSGGRARGLAPALSLFLSFFLFFSEWDWGLNSELWVCKAGVLLLEPHLQSFLQPFYERRTLKASSAPKGPSS
jgi:hypothetical protein